MGRGEGRESFANKRGCIATGREADTEGSLGLKNKRGGWQIIIQGKCHSPFDVSISRLKKIPLQKYNLSSNIRY